MPTNELVDAPRALRQFILSSGANLPGICSLLIRADAYRDVGGFEPDFRGLYEDQVFLSKITCHHGVVVIPEVLDYYRQHDDSCCNRSLKTREYHPEEYHAPRARYLRWLLDYMERQDQPDEIIITAVRQQLRPYDIPFYTTAANFRRRCLRKAEHIHHLLRTDPRAAPLRHVWGKVKPILPLRRPVVPINPTNPPG